MKRSQVLSLLIIILVLASSLSVLGQQSKPKAPAKGLLKVPVWVEDDNGEFWNEGKRESFKVLIEDRAVPIKSFQSPRSSTVVLVVFDTVADLARVDEVRSALLDHFKNLSDQYWIGLLSAQDGLRVLQEPTPDRAALEKTIQTIQVSGKAGLLDTLEPVSRMANAILNKAGVRLSVLYVTDSSIAHYRADYLNPVINSSDRGDLSRRFSDRAVQERMSTLAEALTPFNIPIFVLHLSHRDDTLNLAYQSRLERIAANSGGTAIFCRTSDEIRPSLDSILSRIRSEYVIAVEPPGKKRESLKVHIDVQDSSGKQFNRVKYSSQVNLPNH